MLMDVGYSKEQLAFADSFGAFCAREVALRADAADKTASFPRASFQALAKFGYLGFWIPEAYGGQLEQGDPIVRCLAQEMVAKSCPATAFVCGTSAWSFAEPVVHFGNETLKRRWLPKIASGVAVGAVALTEPHAGSDAAAIQTRAVKKGDRWVLNGAKTYITNAPIADVFLVYAMSNPSAGPLGMTSFVVEKGTKGLSVGKPMQKMGLRGSPTGEVFLEECEVPGDCVLGEPGHGFSLALQGVEWGRLGVGNYCVGIGQACFEDSVHYANERQAFGRPIAGFGDVRSMVAQMAVSIEATRRMAYRVAWTKENVGPCPSDASALKLYASETAMRTAHAAVQIHGGMGFIAECRVERLFRDIRIAEIVDGTSEIQRNILAKEILGHRQV